VGRGESRGGSIQGRARRAGRAGAARSLLPPHSWLLSPSLGRWLLLLSWLLRWLLRWRFTHLLLSMMCIKGWQGDAIPLADIACNALALRTPATLQVH
jgi:hypothetical protein